MKVVCQACGSECVKQSDEIMNGRDDIYSCPVCRGCWQEVDENSLPCQIEANER